jgi:hypothetical protein
VLIFARWAHVSGRTGIKLGEDQTSPSGGYSFMRSTLKAVSLGLTVALLCVPAAFAKGPGGHGHGKPSWAGGGGNGGGHGKPAWAGHGKTHELKAKHDKKAKHQKGASKAEDQASSNEELNLDDLNPAWQCFMVESMMDAKDAEAVAGGAVPGGFSSFDVEFGTNDNKRNSHGQCVSKAAQGDDVSAALADEGQQPCEEAPADEGSSDEGSSDEGAADEGSSDDAAADEGSAEEGTSTSGDESSDEGSGDQADAADDGSSDDQAGEPEDCQSGDDAEQDDQSGEDDQAGEEDQGEDSDAQGDEGDQGDEADAAAFARALVHFLSL